MDVLSLEWWGYIVGGLGIFIFGIGYLGDGLKKVAGSKIKSILDKYASNPIKGALIGAGVTIFIQSSGTTALSIGLIRAGLMSLTQAASIIMGANVGTTITSFIIGLNISQFAPFILVIGAFICLLSSKQKVKYIGDVMFGFAAIFFGMTLMESALRPMSTMPEFIGLVQQLSKTPILGVLVGTIGTAAIQSSSAFIGIVQSLFSASADSGFTIGTALPIIFGSNIGTTITAILAAIGTSKEAKKGAAIHVIFNIFGTILFMLILNPYTSFITYLANIWNLNPKMQIAVSHIIFNVTTTAILLPLSSQLVKLVDKILPSDKQDKLLEVNLSMLDKNVMEFLPSTALGIAKDQTVVMGNLAVQAVAGVQKYFNTQDQEVRDMTLKIEATLDAFDQKLMKFLYSMEHSRLEQSDLHTYSKILKSYKDIERIGDHCENLIEYFDVFFASNETINAEAKQDINDMLTLVYEMLKNSIEAFQYNNTFLANIVAEKEAYLDVLNKEAREKHVHRIVSNLDSGAKYISMVFVDVTGNIERIGDHCQNIIETTLDRVSTNNGKDYEE